MQEPTHHRLCLTFARLALYALRVYLDGMTGPWSEATAENVRAVMARKRRRGTELARVLGLSQTAASRRMSGLTPFDVNELCETAAWLGVPITDLLPEPREGAYLRTTEGYGPGNHLPGVALAA